MEGWSAGKDKYRRVIGDEQIAGGADGVNVKVERSGQRRGSGGVSSRLHEGEFTFG